MNKKEYLEKLRKALNDISITNVESCVEYYSEMIDDRIEDGMSEEDAVNSMESIESIVEASRLEKPMPVLVKEKVQKSKEEAGKNGHGTLWMVLAIIGFPVWFPLLMVLGVILLALYIILVVLVLTFFLVEIAIALAALGCLVLPIAAFATLSLPSAILCIGGFLLLAGLTTLLWKPIVLLAKGTIKIFTGFIRKLKKLIFK